MTDRKDLVVITHLRDNCRKTLTEMSKKSQIPISTIYEKIKRNKDGIIIKHTCLVDFAKLGFNARAKVVIQANINHKQDLMQFLLKHHNINSVYKINNGYDYLIEGIFRNMRELEEFLEILQVKFKVKKQETYFIIDDLKREAFLSDPQTLDLLI
ncbi:Lrp/AsnC family transcriptional regulator [Candidatus Woesearchaeota archaeon]|nr:Lrp/AsnC family transcriptional regulator [Candidatus Woesearchaeota archaeon]